MLNAFSELGLEWTRPFKSQRAKPCLKIRVLEPLFQLGAQGVQKVVLLRV